MWFVVIMWIITERMSLKAEMEQYRVHNEILKYNKWYINTMIVDIEKRKIEAAY